MNRREFFYTAAACALPWAGYAPTADAPAPIPEPHFPSRLYQFVWRNWKLANADRMARVIRTTATTVLQLGASMDLPKKRRLGEDQLARLYITVIRQNWHLLPEQQLIDLLDWDRERYSFTLKEDDSG